jgi:tetratricopeptide (TPR) repeat protein
MKKLVPLLFLLLLLTFFIGLTTILFTPPISKYTGSFAFVFCLSGFLFFSNRHQDPSLRWIILLFAESIILGFGIWFITGNPVFIFLGMIIALSFLAWVNYLRFPVSLWPAIRLNRQKKTSQAIQRVNVVLQTHPKSWAAYRLRHELYLKNMELVEAEHDARSMLRLKPDSPEAHLLLVLTLFTQGRYQETKQACEELLKLKPRNGTNLYNLGVSSYRLGEYPRCIETLSQVIRKSLPLNIHNLLAHYYLARSLETTGQRKLALKIYGKMHRFSNDLKKYIQQANSYPDHPEIVLFRSDLRDIEERLTLKQKRE